MHLCQHVVIIIITGKDGKAIWVSILTEGRTKVLSSSYDCVGVMSLKKLSGFVEVNSTQNSAISRAGQRI